MRQFENNQFKYLSSVINFIGVKQFAAKGSLTDTVSLTIDLVLEETNVDC